MTSRAPSVAVLANCSVAVICAGDVSVTFDTVIPAPMLTTAPAANAEPLIVTETVVPGEPWFGEIEVTAGRSAASA